MPDPTPCTSFVNFTGTHFDRVNGTNDNYFIDGHSTNALSDAGPVAYFGQGGTTGPDLNGNAPFQTTNPVRAASASFFYAVTSSSMSYDNAVLANRFHNSGALGRFTLTATGNGGYTLRYRIDAAAPTGPDAAPE
jgi:hypothetical protein